MFGALKRMLGRPAAAAPARATDPAADDRVRAQRCRSEGNAKLAQGELAEAERLYAQAVAFDPNDAALHVNLGYVRLEQGRHAAALESLARAIALDGASADARYFAGRACQELGHAAEAQAHLRQAVAIDPGFAHAWLDLGRVRLAVGDPGGAVAALDHAVRAQPQLSEARLLLATALLQLGRGDDALRCSNELVAASPELPSGHLCRGRALRLLGRAGDALAAFERALALGADAPDAHYGRGLALIDLGRFAQALESVETALARSSAAASGDRAALLQARSVALSGQWRYEEALESARAAVDMDPAEPEGWCVLAGVQQRLGRADDALETYAQARQRHPENPQIRWDESLWRLLLGDFERGWQGHEWRLRSPMYSPVNASAPSAAPRWSGGEALSERRILLHSEQGLGDAIQFARYVDSVAQAGAQAIVQVPQPLVPLMKRLVGASGEPLPSVTVIGPSEIAPPHDLQCPLLSLPAAFGKRLDAIPVRAPYLVADQERTGAYRRTMDDGGGQRRRRIGLAWSGNPRHRNDHNRSLPLARVAQALPAECDLVTLQPDVAPADVELLRGAGFAVHDLGRTLRDFADTAALVAALDLVVTVDTSVAHLTGALGRPVWILIPHLPDWRWLLDREDSPWYPTARLFRQTAPGDWEPTLHRLRLALARWCAAS